MTGKDAKPGNRVGYAGPPLRRRAKVGALAVEALDLAAMGFRAGTHGAVFNAHILGLDLFRTDLAPWRALLAELGAPPDYDGRIEPGAGAAIVAALGRPDPSDVADLRAGLAFALVQFAHWDSQMREAVAAGNAAVAADIGVMIGRILEWWRWRGSGADAKAVARQRQDAALTRAAEAAAAKRKAPAWHATAREEAKTMRERGWSTNRAAEALAGKFGKSSRAVATVIAPLWK